jgi:hypothetical protein
MFPKITVGMASVTPWVDVILIQCPYSRGHLILHDQWLVFCQEILGICQSMNVKRVQHDLSAMCSFSLLWLMPDDNVSSLDHAASDQSLSVEKHPRTVLAFVPLCEYPSLFHGSESRRYQFPVANLAGCHQMCRDALCESLWLSKISGLSWQLLHSHWPGDRDFLEWKRISQKEKNHVPILKHLKGCHVRLIHV